MKNFNYKKYTLIAVSGLMVLGLLYVSTMSAVREVNKYTIAWKEIQFAKNHPTLVEPMRVYYENGVAALDKLVVEQNVPGQKTGSSKE